MNNITSNNFKYKFLINTFTDWNEPPRARHQVAFALANSYPVIFISSNRIGFPGLSLLQVSNNLQVIIPYFPFDYRIRIRIPVLNKLYQYWLFRQLKKTYNDYCVINFDFTARYLFRYFRDVIYYCNDDHVGLSYRLNRKWIAQYQDLSERIVAKESKFCIGTSKFLVDRLKQYNNMTFELRLGAPVIDFNPDATQKPQTQKINVGFVGFIETVDKRLINYLLSHDDINFTLIGPFKPKVQQTLGKYKNVRMTGKLTGIDLYKEVSKFDVGIVPYNIRCEIDRTPNKLWLYLALGVPVVIPNIKSIRDWEFPEKFIYLSIDENEFYEKIHTAHTDNNRTLMKERAEFARKNSWNQRMIDLLRFCDKYLK